MDNTVLREQVKSILYGEINEEIYAKCKAQARANGCTYQETVAEYASEIEPGLVLDAIMHLLHQAELRGGISELSSISMSEKALTARSGEVGKFLTVDDRISKLTKELEGIK